MSISNSHSQLKQTSPQNDKAQSNKLSPKAINKFNENPEERFFTIRGQQFILKPAPKKPKKTKINFIFLFILNCILTLNVACQNIIFFFMESSEFQYYYIVPTIIIMIIFFFANSLYSAKNWIQFLGVMFLVDNMLLTQIVASIGYVGLSKVYFSQDWDQYFAIISVPLLHFLLCTNFRFTILKYQLKKLQTITYKLVLLSGALVYFGIGTYIMYFDYKVTSGLEPQIDSTFKDFSLLYTFGNFAFFSQLIGKTTDFDQSGDLQPVYQVVQSNDSEEEHFILQRDVSNHEQFRDENQQVRSLKQRSNQKNKNIQRRSEQKSSAKKNKNLQNLIRIYLANRLGNNESESQAYIGEQNQGRGGSLIRQQAVTDQINYIPGPQNALQIQMSMIRDL